MVVFQSSLVPKLQQEGHRVDHIILLGIRGTADQAIVDLLNSEDLLFLTHDQEFFEIALSRSRVIISRITQSLPITVRIEIGLQAIREYFSHDWPETVFEVFDDGKLNPWEKPGSSKS